jgi:hypothetical protein
MRLLPLGKRQAQALDLSVSRAILERDRENTARRGADRRRSRLVDRDRVDRS